MKLKKTKLIDGKSKFIDKFEYFQFTSDLLDMVTTKKYKKKLVLLLEVIEVFC